MLRLVNLHRGKRFREVVILTALHRVVQVALTMLVMLQVRQVEAIQAQVDIFNIVVYIDIFTGGNEWSVR